MKKILGIFLSISVILGQISFIGEIKASEQSEMNVSASSYLASNLPNAAIDGNPETYWSASDTVSSEEKKYSEKYLQIDLGSSKKISAIEITPRKGSTDAERSDFELRLSNTEDFSNYVKIPCVINTAVYPNRLRVGEIFAADETYRKDINLPEAYRYVRYVKLYDTKTTDKNMTTPATVAEIEIETMNDSGDTSGNSDVSYSAKADFLDAAGDKSNIFVKNSEMKFKGELKNNTDTNVDVYCIIAGYDESGRLKSLGMTEKEAQAEKTAELEASLNVGSDYTRVSGFILKKDDLKPICKMHDTVNYYTENNLDVFVSQENGDDTNDGTILAPLKTMSAAESKAQSLISKGKVNVYIKNGEYLIDETFEITKNGKNITYRGFGNDETLFSGGKKVTGFVDEGNGIYSADLDLEYVSDIYVNDERRYVASSDVLLGKSEVFDSENGVYGPVVDGDMLPENISFTQGMEIFYPAVVWRSHTLKLNGVTKTDEGCFLSVTPKTVITDRTTYEQISMDFDARPFYLKNSKQLLDEEGEWYFDSTAKKIYYIPYSDEKIEECEVYASGKVDTLIRIKDGIYYRNFENLTFAHTGWKNAYENGELRWQANNQILPSSSSYGSTPHNIPIPGALQASFSSYINVKNCIFKHTGAAGLVLNGNTANNTIEGNVFYDIADSSMYLGYKTPSEYRVKNTNIKNNVISGIGKKYYTAAGLNVFGAKNIYISHNDISDCPYTGIHAGPLVWANEFTADSEADHEAGSYSDDIHIEYNKIHEIAKTNVDGGGIYTLGHCHGSTIIGNYIKNQYLDYSAIYNDDGSACFEIKDNVLENVPGWLYHWTNSIRFMNASNNYSTTNEDYAGLKSINSSIEAVNIFESNNKPEAVKTIIENAGLESEYAEKIGKYVKENEDIISPNFESVNITTKTGTETMLSAGFKANESGRYRWKAIGQNSSKVSFKDSLTPYWKKGIQFDKIYATFSASGTYEIVCESDDGRGIIYANKINVTVE